MSNKIILFFVGHLLGCDISLSVFCPKGRSVRLNLATKCYNALSAFKPLAFGSIQSFSFLAFYAIWCPRLVSQSLGLWFFLFCFLRVAIVVLNAQLQYKMWNQSSVCSDVSGCLKVMLSNLWVLSQSHLFF